MKSTNRSEGSRRFPMGVMRLRAMVTRLPWLSRGLAAGIAFSLVLAFTPCCDIFGEAHAAPAPGDVESHHAPASDNDLHSHESDGSGGICGKWLDDTSPPGAISYGVLIPSWEGKAIMLLALIHHPLMLPRADTLQWRSLHSQSPPPRALYLRFVRLLI